MKIKHLISEEVIKADFGGFKGTRVCKACRGRGEFADGEMECSICDGEGKVRVFDDDATGEYEEPIKKKVNENATPSFSSALKNYLDELHKYHDEYYAKNYDNLKPPKFSTDVGRKFIRIVQTNDSGGRSVHCFIDMDGNIYKAAGWNAPAKGIRGSIYKPPFPLAGREFYR